MVVACERSYPQPPHPPQNTHNSTHRAQWCETGRLQSVAGRLDAGLKSVLLGDLELNPGVEGLFQFGRNAASGLVLKAAGFSMGFLARYGGY